MKHLILALLAVALSMPAMAGKPSKDQIIDNAAPVEATTVKGSKSNSDNVSERTVTIKSTKSNTSDRASGAAGLGTITNDDTNPNRAVTVKGSKSNSDNRNVGPTSPLGPAGIAVGDEGTPSDPIPGGCKTCVPIVKARIKAPGLTNPDPLSAEAVTIKSSKSNSSERTVEQAASCNFTIDQAGVKRIASDKAQKACRAQRVLQDQDRQ
jgi:hypothetical protein